MIYDVNGNPIGSETTEDASSVFKTTEGVVASNLANTSVKRPYWVFHLDCARKYFSVANIKILIDLMSANGLNQLQLHFSENEGLRFGLDDMNIIDVDGNTYDLSTCLTTSNGGYLSQSDMDEIIVYSRSKHIDVVPSLDMPGHMNTILYKFPQFRYAGHNRTLDVKSDSAKKFAFAIIEKYARYFKSRGCIFYNIGADEVAGPIGRWSSISSGDEHYFLEFVNEAANIVSRCGLIPRVFNDGVMYNRDRSVYFNKNMQVYCWSRVDGNTNLTTDELLSNGFELINANIGYYYIIPGSYGAYNKDLTVNSLLTALGTGTTTRSQSGFMFCVWCDSDDSAHAGDGGDGVIADMRTIIPSLGTGIANSTATIDYPILSD